MSSIVSTIKATIKAIITTVKTTVKSVVATVVATIKAVVTSIKARSIICVIGSYYGFQIGQCRIAFINILKAYITATRRHIYSCTIIRTNIWGFIL